MGEHHQRGFNVGDYKEKDKKVEDKLVRRHFPTQEQVGDKMFHMGDKKVYRYLPNGALRRVGKKRKK